MKASLANGVYITACDEDLVVLDTRADLYSCLPEAAHHLTLGAGFVEGPQAVLSDLATAGLTVDYRSAPRRSVPSLPTRILALPPGRPSLQDEIAFWRAALDAWRLGPARRSLSDLLADVGPAPSSAPDLDRIARLTSVFARRLPWVPGQGACLYRAWFLRRLLRSAGQDAAWVFAVKTWPFGAHCWLQVDDAVLDDDPDRVSLYTPILAV